MDRLRRLWSLLGDTTDCVLIINSNKTDPNFQYYSGVEGLDSGALLLRGDERTVFHSQSRRVSGQVKKVKVKKKLSEELASAVKKGETVGINGNCMSVSLLKKLKKELKGRRFKDISKDLSVNRAVKEKKEVKAIRKTAAIADKAMEVAESALKQGVTELEVLAEVNRFLTEKEANSPLDPIIAFGKNSAYIHHKAGKTKLKKKDLVVADIFPCHKGYWSDMTRTFCLKPGRREREVFEMVKEAQEKAINGIREGLEGRECYNLSNSFFRENKVEKNFMHSLGHGVGLAIHEAPSLGPEDKMKMQNGMVFTVEPGLYFKGYGGVRIEDTLLLDSKCRRISRYECTVLKE